MALMVLTILCLLGAIGLLLLGNTIGWLLFIPVAPFGMAAGWGFGELRDIPAVANPKTIDDVLSSSLLGKLPNAYTVKDLAEVSLRTREGGFLALRFGLTSQVFGAIVEHTNIPIERIWQRADQLRVETGATVIDPVMVLGSILLSTPNVDMILAQLQIDSDDIIEGVKWYNHIHEVIAEITKRRKDGGIGRDWSFGYTPLLSRFGVNVSEHAGRVIRDVDAHNQIVDRLIHLFTQGGRQNAALIGGIGTGKSTLIAAFAERLMQVDQSVPKALRFQQVYSLDPSTIISGAKGRGELEGLLQHIFSEAFSAKNIILFLDDAHLFFEDGTGSVDVSNVLLPVLEGGALKIILAMEEQHWLRISQTNPALAQYLNRVFVEPTNENDTMRIMEDQLLYIEHRQKVNYTYQAMQEAYRLSDRYMRDQSMPGKALMLLESAAGYAEDKIVTHLSVRQAIEQTIGVKVGTADTTEERQTLLNLEDRIHERMINQTRAVQVVSDALRRARAGVRNQNRPIGTFLFLGPTGVGKTELAKALASVYFGGEDHLVRIDLNEYVQSSDVSRLIADAAHDSHSLAAQIAKQPFSVILLDEIEKAHPDVLNTLLQLLDEGILRDITNKEVSFRDAIIIATSNAGADRIRQYIDAGWQMQDFEQRFTDELISSNQFRPEFLNRFDEIVLFRPLNQEELLKVIDLILDGINKTLAPQKMSIMVEDEAKRVLVQAGYDPRMGARPMRRIVQRAVENIVARRMLGGEVMPGEQVHITLQDVQTILQQDQTRQLNTPPVPESPISVEQATDSVSLDLHPKE